MTDHKAYLVEYPFAGSQWGLTIMAKDWDEAEARLKAMGWAKVKGELKATIPVPLGRVFWASLGVVQMTDNAGLKGAARIAAEQVASTKNVRIKPDIVERLRGYLTRETALEAADEIERLRTQVHDLTEAVNIEYVGSVAQARNDALEEAARVVDEMLLADLGEDIVFAIRALKEKASV